jgi:ergothioneine biosynthesis protein EgtB
MRSALEQSIGFNATLTEKYVEVREASLSLCRPLTPEDCVIQTIPEVSPTKWHLAHVTWFFERFCLLAYGNDYRPYDERFDYLFNSYYYSIGHMHNRNQRGLLSRPPLDEILDYRAHVDDALLALLAAHPENADLAFAVTLGLQHEQQHQELLLTDIKHVFFVNPLNPIYADPRAYAASADVPLKFVACPSGRRAIGSDGVEFCFDNETPRHDTLVGDYALANRLVTNGDYREFIDEGGYQESLLWLADGWARVRNDDWSRPMYWSEDLESEFTLGGWQPIDPASPVCHVSFYEADAFARWAGARLPSESEWELAASTTRIVGNTLDRGQRHPRPLAADDAADGAVFQLWGDAWEWTASAYAPYPRFKPLAGSLGEYNGKFMANQMVVRGGSCATWASHLRATYRSFFYPHDRWQFLGLRLAKDLA